MSAWGDGEPYCWVVVCKNKKYHNRQNIYSGHKIALCETDEFSIAPDIGTFTVCCDECGVEEAYNTEDLMRFQMALDSGFRPHRLFG
jgi:hypothetical protein